MRSVLKIRYLLLGGALGGGASLAKQYEDWKKNLPDTDWVKDLIPDIDLNRVTSDMRKAGENIRGKANEIDLDPALKKVIDFRQWFEKRLDAAIQAADKDEKKAIKFDQPDIAKEAENKETTEEQKTQQTVEDKKTGEKPVEKPNLDKPVQENLGGASMYFLLIHNTECLKLTVIHRRNLIF